MAESNLTDFIDAVCTQSHLRVETDFGDGFVRLKSEEAERRQAAHDIRSTEDALIELLRNSRDAHAHSIFIATTKTEGKRKILVIDDGDGMPENMEELIFEPRVTSKLDTMHFDKWGVHGRGMALYAVRVNAISCGVALSQPGKGTALFADFDITKTSEKTDQSTFPAFTLCETKVSIRGPKNIIRTSCEFAFEHRNNVEVFLGSPVEIAATLYAYGKATVSLLDQTFSNPLNELPLVKQLAVSADEDAFCKTAKNLGIELSKRSAYRIMNDEIAPLPSLLDQIQSALFAPVANHNANEHFEKNAEPMPQKHIPRGKVKSPSFTPSDLNAFTLQVKHAFKDLADAYYLEPDVNVSAQVRNNQLVLRLPLAPHSSA